MERGSREYPRHPLVGVGALIHDGKGRILLIKRRNEPNKGRWSLPGGLLETGERIEDAVRREVREELGVEITLESLFQVSEELIPDDAGKTKYHFVLVDYLARLDKPGAKIVLNEESESFAWFAAQLVGSMDVTENTKIIANKFLREIATDSGH